MAYAIGVATSIGVGPEHGGRERNEDNYLVCYDGEIRYHEDGSAHFVDRDGDGAVIAVCDGMGGHDDGHIASLTAAKVLAQLYQPGVPSNPEKALLKYVRESHATLHWKTAEAGPVRMGTTVSVAWLLHGTLSWVNVGDSRIYRFRDQRLEQLSLDQTRREFARRDGRQLASDEEDHLVQNFIFGSRGLGDNASLRLEPGLDSGSVPLEPADVFLLCSDGVWGSVVPADVERILGEIGDMQDAADALVQRGMECGATDNLTAVLLRVSETEPPDLDWEPNFDVLRTL